MVVPICNPRTWGSGDGQILLADMESSRVIEDPLSKEIKERVIQSMKSDSEQYMHTFKWRDMHTHIHYTHTKRKLA